MLEKSPRIRNSAKSDALESFNGDWWGSWLKVVGEMGMINVICSALGMQALTKLLPLAPGLSNNDIVSIVLVVVVNNLSLNKEHCTLAPWVLVPVTGPEVKCHDLLLTQP